MLSMFKGVVSKFSLAIWNHVPNAPPRHPSLPILELGVERRALEAGNTDDVGVDGRARVAAHAMHRI